MKTKLSQHSTRPTTIRTFHNHTRRIQQRAIAGLFTAALILVNLEAASSITPIGTWPGFVRGNPYQMCMQDSLVFLNSGPSVQVVSLEQATHPFLAGGFTTRSDVSALSIDDTTAYVGHWDGMDVMDFGGPAAPQRLSSIQSIRSCRAVRKLGEYVFVSGEFMSDSAKAWVPGVRIYEVSNPASPVLINEFSTGFGIEDMVISDGIVYLVGGEWFQVLEVNNTTQLPVSLSKVRVANSVRGLTVSEGLALISCADQGLILYDISNPRSPVRRGAVDTAGEAWAAAAQGGYAYVADGYSGRLEIIDIQNASAPRRVAALTGPEDVGTARDIEVFDGYAVIVCDGGVLQILDIGNPAAPVCVCSLNVAGWSSGLDVRGVTAFLADGAAGLKILDISDPSLPQYVGGIDTPGEAMDVAAGEGVAIVADGGAGLQLIDISDPSNPQSLSRLNLDGYVRRVQRNGNIAVVTADDMGIHLCDVSVPGSPRRIGGYDSPGSASDVCAVGSLAYVADGDSGLLILDISTPSSPRRVAQVPGIYARAVHVANNVAYIGGGYLLSIFDVQDPASPRLLGSLQTPETVAAVHAEGRYAYIANDVWTWPLGSRQVVVLRIIDVSIPSQPFAVGRYEGLTAALDIHVVADHVYLPQREAGLVMLQLPTEPASVLEQPESQTVASGGCATLRVGAFGDGPLTYQWYVGAAGDTSSPIVGGTEPEYRMKLLYDSCSCWVRVSHANGWVDSNAALVRVVPGIALTQLGAWPDYVGGPVLDIALSGDVAYLAVGDGGVHVVQIDASGRPQRIGSIDLAAYIPSIALSGKYCYAAAGGAGLFVIDISNPVQPRVVSQYRDEGYTANSIAVSGRWAYVAGGRWNDASQMQADGLLVLDLSDPAQPIRCGGYSTREQCTRVVVRDDYAYLLGGYWDGSWNGREALLILDLSRPGAPKKIGSYDARERFSSVSVESDRAYLSGGYWANDRIMDSLLILDVTDRSRPQRLGGFSKGDAWGQAVQVQGNVAYLAANYRGVMVLDVTNPAVPTLVGTQSPDGAARSVAVFESQLYWGDERTGFHVVDVSNPAAPQEQGQLDTFLDIVDLELNAASIGCARSDTMGVPLFDCSDAYTLRPLGSIQDANVGSWGGGLQLEGSLAYMTDGSGVRIIDISNALQPKDAGRWDDPSGIGVSAATIRGDTLYLTGEGLRVLDISTPTQPTVVGAVYLSGWPRAIAVADGLAYLAIPGGCSPGSLQIVDVTTPAAMEALSAIYMEGSTRAVCVKDNYALLMGNGFTVVDATDPSHPIVAARIPDVTGDDLCRIGDYVFVASWDGLTVVDVSEPSLPAVVGRTSSLSTRGVTFAGDIVFAAMGNRGLRSFAFVPTVALRPPAIAGSTMHFSWADASGWRLQVATDLTDAVWVDVAGPDGQTSVDVLVQGTQAYYRLSRAPQ